MPVTIPRNTITQVQLKELLHYDPETGIFTRLRGKGKGTIAGTLHHGYIEIRAGGPIYGAHRLAWLYVHGELPENEIDHRDGNRSNNRISNLREATRQDNNINRKRPKHNASGIKGVFLEKRYGTWTAQITHNGNQMNLGSFKTKEEAAAVLTAKRIELHGEFCNHG